MGVGRQGREEGPRKGGQRGRIGKRGREHLVFSDILITKFLLLFLTRRLIISLSPSYPSPRGLPAQWHWPATPLCLLFPFLAFRLWTTEPPLPNYQSRQQTSISDCSLDPKCKKIKSNQIKTTTTKTNRKQLEVLQVPCSKSDLAYQKLNKNNLASHASVCSSPMKFPQPRAKHSKPVVVKAGTQLGVTRVSLFLMISGNHLWEGTTGKHSLALSTPFNLIHYSRFPVPGLVSHLWALCPHRGQMFKITFWSTNLPIQTTDWPVESI